MSLNAPWDAQQRHRPFTDELSILTQYHNIYTRIIPVSLIKVSASERDATIPPPFYLLFYDFSFVFKFFNLSAQKKAVNVLSD